MALVTRSGKGAILTHEEMDANFSGLADGSLITGSGVTDVQASNVSYTPSGSGAQSRTVQAKLREFVTVTDFGATGDGSTDDTTAASNAITAAGIGGTVYWPAGVYVISSTLTPLIGQKHIGEGVPQDNLSSPYVPTVGQSTFVKYTGSTGWAFDLSGCSYAYIENFAGTATSTTDGFIQVNNSLFCHGKNLLIRSVPLGTAIKIIDTDGGAFFNTFENVKIQTSVLRGIWLAEGANGHVNNNTFRNIDITGGVVGKAILIDCGNMNLFDMVAPEPAATTAHIHVTGGYSIFRALRIEGTVGTAGYFHIEGGRVSVDGEELGGGFEVRDINAASQFYLPPGIDNLIPDPLFMKNGSYPHGFALSTGTVSTAERSTTRPPFAKTTADSGYSSHIVSSSGAVNVRYRITDADFLAAAVAAGRADGYLWARSAVGTAGFTVFQESPTGNTSNASTNDRTDEWQFLRSGVEVKADITALSLIFTLSATSDDGYFYMPCLVIGKHHYNHPRRTVHTSGGQTIYGDLKFVQGASTGELLPMTLAQNNTTFAQNVTTGEDNLTTYGMPLSAFNAAAKGVKVMQHGRFVNNANAKTLKSYFGSATLVNLSLPTSQAGQWRIEYECTATGTDTQDYSGKYIYESAAGTFTTVLFRGTATEDDGAQIVIKCTGEATATGDVIQEAQRVEFLN